MDKFAEIADERRTLSQLLSELSPDQQTTPSLCSQWTVHDVAAHLIMPLEVSTPKLVLAMLLSRGNFPPGQCEVDPGASPPTFQRDRRGAATESRLQIHAPGSGPEAPLTDLLVHGVDIRRPLGLPRDIPADRVRTSLTFLATARPGAVVRKGALDGLRWEATDIDWAHGSGATVRGPGDALLPALTGRTADLAHLSGDGAPTLRARLA